MEHVRKTFFNPLATSKAQIRELLQSLPVGSAHPYSPQHLLLCRTDNGIDEIDISSYPEDYFYNAVDLGEMGEVLLRRMAGFNLNVFGDFQIQQAPAATFKVPVEPGQITILAVSERTPTYYDFCFADAQYNTCCWAARDTFPGIAHSGDILNGQDFLAHVKIDANKLTDKEICVFISGYQSTQITRFLGTHPALLVANHVDKVLYIVPVPLDAATIGDATICCPLVIKRDGDALICSILPKAATDRKIMCSSNKLVSPCFPEAIRSADFNLSAAAQVIIPATSEEDNADERAVSATKSLLKEPGRGNAVIATLSVTIPSFLDMKQIQLIRFGTGIDFKLAGTEQRTEAEMSKVVLPCVFGSQLEGPVLLATGTVPSNVPFLDANALHDYYNRLESVVVIVDDRMTDNARNLATQYRINAVFIVQLNPETEPKDTDGVLNLMNSVNINAVTALAGPQSLILVQVSDKYYFYRGIANRAHLNTSGLAFGSDVTDVLERVGAGSLTDPRAARIINLNMPNSILFPVSDQLIKGRDLEGIFQTLHIEKLKELEEDIAAAVPQLQSLMNQQDLQELSKTLLDALSAKISNEMAPMRNAYIHFLTQEHEITDKGSTNKKNRMLGELRSATKELQMALGPIISSFSNMMSTQTTSKRTHDLKRLARQAQIQGNVTAAKSMNFETVAGYLETHAGDMGVLLLNIEYDLFSQLLGEMKKATIDATPYCDLDSRVLYLQGFDAGIIIEQSQQEHIGPLQSQSGPSRPVMALPYLGQGRGIGSMLAWVCWDEFVNLEDPYSVRWMEKCNEAHIAALRIIMRDTLSNAVASRTFDIHPGSVETGRLMSALLMASMSKLASMRSTAPAVVGSAEDTTTRLMRGLFGNLLTTAGSGVRPLSMVWQLFGMSPQYDIPTTDADWIWYQTVVALYPYTAWPRERFHENLERLLDKAIVRVITKAEEVYKSKEKSVDAMIKFCKLRNIQLAHSRTIITCFMHMLTMEDAEMAPIAKRLLDVLPPKLERQTHSYSRMIEYLGDLASGGQRDGPEDLVAASVYTKRSAVFAELKAKVSEACQNSDWDQMKAACQQLMDKRAELAALWRVNAESLKFQNMKAYKDLLEAEFGDDAAFGTKAAHHEITRRILSDAELKQIPWQVGKRGQFVGSIEPLDEAFVHEILTGERLDVKTSTETAAAEEDALQVEANEPDDAFSAFKSSLQASFISAMQKELTAEQACAMLKVPVPAMVVFAKALNPEFGWHELGGRFKLVMMALLRNRSMRLESRPIRALLLMEGDRKRIGG